MSDMLIVTLFLSVFLGVLFGVLFEVLLRWLEQREVRQMRYKVYERHLQEGSLPSKVRIQMYAELGLKREEEE